MSACEHNRLFQFSTIWARTDWGRPDPSGDYATNESICSKVLDEETTGWECCDCGAAHPGPEDE